MLVVAASSGSHGQVLALLYSSSPKWVLLPGAVAKDMRGISTLVSWSANVQTRK